VLNQACDDDDMPVLAEYVHSSNEYCIEPSSTDARVDGAAT
jgi:hypothetical protein